MILKVDDEKCFETCVSALKNGEVVILPTDTIYGFSGIVPEAELKILEIKKRSLEKKMIRLIAKPEDAFLYTDQNIPSVFLKKWPGALTLIVKSKDSGEHIALRCPGNEWLRKLIESVGKPIYSSSANYSGEKELFTIKEIKKTFEKKVFLIVDAGELQGLPSTVVDITYDEPMILRRGSVAI